jgi:hypothetical protein
MIDAVTTNKTDFSGARPFQFLTDALCRNFLSRASRQKEVYGLERAAHRVSLIRSQLS